MFLRVRDLVIPMSSVSLIDLNNRPLRAGGVSVRIELGAFGDPVEVHGPEAEYLREMIEDLTVDYRHHDGQPFGPDTIVAFGPGGPDLALHLRSGRSGA